MIDHAPERPYTCRERSHVGLDAVYFYIVTIDVPASVFRERLEAISGARPIRELPPRRVVVALPSAGDCSQLAALPGVEALVVDRLEHPDRPA
jgi:hypothetical protein